MKECKDFKKCLACQYFYKGGVMCCTYILETLTPRGCEIGSKCDKFIPKEKGRIYDQFKMKYKEN